MVGFSLRLIGVWANFHIFEPTWKEDVGDCLNAVDSLCGMCQESGLLLIYLLFLVFRGFRFLRQLQPYSWLWEECRGDMQWLFSGSHCFCRTRMCTRCSAEGVLCSSGYILQHCVSSFTTPSLICCRSCRLHRYVLYRFLLLSSFHLAICSRKS